MALIVTPGAADADAFVTLAAFKAHCDAVGYDYAAYDDATQIEPAIRRATTYLSASFTWKGHKTNGRAQALAWPRTGVTDGEGDDVSPDEIPAEIERACCEAAWYELGNPGGLSPSVSLTDRVRRERVGPLEVEYAATSQTADAARPILTSVDDLVSGLLAGTVNSLVGTAVRS